MKKHILVLSVLAISAATVLAGCGNGASKDAAAGTSKKSDLAMTVGSKDNTENNLIGEMYAEIFEDMGMKVTRKLSLGGTAPTFEALKKGDLDIYPEYTGTGLTVMLKQPVEKDQAKVEKTLSEGFK